MRSARGFLVATVVACLALPLVSHAAQQKPATPTKPAPAAKPASAAKPAPKPPPVRDFAGTKVLALSHLMPSEAKQLMDAVCLGLVYDMGYRESDGATGAWQLASDENLRVRRLFEKHVQGSRRTLEMGCRGFDRLGVRLVLAGSGRGRAAKEALVDYEGMLARIATSDKQIVAQQRKLGLRRFAMDTIQLNYVKVDRALASLKLMGYSVVEFKESDFRKSVTPKMTLAKVFDPVTVKDPVLPVIARMIDSECTWLDKEGGARRAGKLQLSVTPDIGGKDLPEVTTSDAQQRLLVIYDPGDLESLYGLKNMLTEHIDVPARQIVIECMVIEVIENKLKELGLSFSRLQLRQGGQLNLTFEDAAGPGGDVIRPFTFTFDDAVQGPQLKEFRATLRALLRDGAAEILSKPSVLALNNHQARIRVGREIPILSSVITTRTTNLQIEYFPVGIVLNIKPRIGYDDAEVSLQVEAIVSSEDPDDRLTAADPSTPGQTIDLAPFVNTRIVQTYARVTNGTPFIIGGLVAREKRETQDRVPFLSKIPLIGRLFTSREARHVRSEVIIVLTPHIVPQHIQNFSYIVPKDSDIFDSMESQLFRSAYRLRGGDVFDLRFLYESSVLTRMRERVAQAIAVQPSLVDDPVVGQFTKDSVPGEAVLVRRQLYEIIRRLELHTKIETRQLIFFKSAKDRATGFGVAFLGKELQAIEAGFFSKSVDKSDKALALLFDRPVPGGTAGLYSKPVAQVEIKDIGKGKARAQEAKRILYELNRGQQQAIVISSEDDLTRLKIALIIKELIEINSPREALRLKNFQVGRHLLFPGFPKTDHGERQRKFYLVDDVVAQCFYQTEFYYAAFRDEFNETLEKASGVVDGVLDQQPAAP